MSKMNKTTRLVITGLFAALICISISLFHIPTGINGGYIHLGDTFIYLSACFLPMPYAMVSAAIGGGLADGLTGAIIWVIPTIIIKPLLVILFSYSSKKIICIRNIFGVFLSGIIGVIGYFIAEGIIYGSFIAALASVPLQLIQPIGSGIIFILVGYALDKIKIKEKLNIEA